MIFLYILLSIIALTSLILFTHIRVKIEFSDDFYLKIYFGLIKIPENLLKKTNKKKSNKNSQTDEKKSKQKSNKLLQKIKKKGYYESLVEVLDFLKPLLSILEKFVNKIKVNPLIIKIKMTGFDAADLAIDYGKFCVVYYPLIELVDSKTKCKNISSDVFVDYVSKENEIYLKTELKIRLIHVLSDGFKIIMEFIKFKEKFD